jgi:hypothetical protein
MIRGWVCAHIGQRADFPFGLLRTPRPRIRESTDVRGPVATDHGGVSPTHPGGTAMEIRRKFLVEGRSHAVWAVELHDHQIRACCGPLLPDEVDEDLLDTFEYAEAGAAWIRENEEHFTPLVIQVPEIPGM